MVGVARRVPRRPAAGARTRVATWVACDVAAPTAVDVLVPAFAGADAVVHLAWAIQPSHDRRRLHDVNVSGTRHVLDAARRAGVPHVVVASSVGAYSPAPDDVPRGEGWATDGVRSSSYSVDKAAVERTLDEFEAAHPDLAIARVRPALVFQRAAGHEISRYFLGPWAPKRAIAGHLAGAAVAGGPAAPGGARGRRRVRVPGGVVRRVKGPFNVAAPDVLRGQDVADVVSRGRLREVGVPAGPRAPRGRLARAGGARRSRAGWTWPSPRRCSTRRAPSVSSTGGPPGRPSTPSGTWWPGSPPGRGPRARPCGRGGCERLASSTA